MQKNGRRCGYYIKIITNKKHNYKGFSSLTKANKFIKRIKENDKG
jgi:hypothetical protein